MDQTVSPQHQAQAGGAWEKLPFCLQMANIGSEISRAFNWKNKNNPQYSEKALVRAFELIGLTARSLKKQSQLKELLRVQEALLDYFNGSNEFHSSESLWRNYFDHFAYWAANPNRPA